MDSTEKTERVGVDIRIALSSGARVADLKRREGSNASGIHLGASSGPSTVRQKIKAVGRRIARTLYRAIRPVVRPIGFRMRAYFSSLLLEEIQQLNQRTSEKLAQQSRQQQQLTERLFYKHTADILRALKASPNAAAPAPREAAAAHGMAALIQKVLTPGDTFVDVGTGVGAHTLAVALALGGQGRIVAFEARESVQLDDVLGQGTRADLVRIEAGAAILQVLEGASGVLAANPNIALVVELGAADDLADNAWLQWLERQGFRHAVADPASGTAATLLLFARPGSPAWARVQGAG